MEKVEVDMEYDSLREEKRTPFYDKDRRSIFEHEVLRLASQHGCHYFLVIRVIDDEGKTVGHTFSDVDWVRPNVCFQALQPINIKNEPKLIIQKDCDKLEIIGEIKLYSEEAQKRRTEQLIRELNNRVFIPLTLEC